MVTKVCAHHVEKMRQIYRRFISSECAFGKMVLKIAIFFNIKIIIMIAENFEVWPIFIFFIIMVTRVCAYHVEKIRKVYRRFISLEGAFHKMMQRRSKFLTFRS